MADFSALHVALSAVRAARTGLDTTSNNVANVSTPGYTRQRVLLRSSHHREVPGGLVGTGVTIGDIGRVRDQLADVRVRGNAASLGFAEVRAELLGHTEVVFGEPDTGISSALSGLWAALDEVALAPADPGARSAVLGNLEVAAARFREVASGLRQMSNLATESLNQAVVDANDMLTQVADLNDAIVASAHPAPDLLDRRDVLLDELSGMLGAKVIPQDDGAVRVTLNGLSLVSDTRPTLLSINGAGDIEAGGVVLDPSGEIGGLHTFINDDVTASVAGLDILAEDLVAALNTAHAAGFSASGPGGDLLTFTPGSAAASMTVVIADPDDLATAGTAGPPFPAHDATNAENMAALRDALSASGGTASLSTAIRELVTDVGQRTAAAASSAASSGQLYATSLDDRESRIGVSLDEEMVSLMEYQRMYEAASRVITAVDQALDVLVNRTGVVGR